MNGIQFEDMLAWIEQVPLPVPHISDPCFDITGIPCDRVSVKNLYDQPPGNPAELFRTSSY